MTNDDTPKPDERITVVINGEPFVYVLHHPPAIGILVAWAVGTTAALHIVDALLGTPFAVFVAVAGVILSALALILGD